MGGQDAGSSSAGTRDIHFVHAYLVYQLLSRRIQRDLLLVSALLSSQHSQAVRPGMAPKVQTVDGRLYPAIVKLLDTVLQGLTQMRTLSIVDDSPDLALAVEGRISFTKAQRCAMNLTPIA
jgi:signal recognition particle subunit SRP68